MKAVFLGATKGMGRALARLMAERGDRLFLLGRNADDLKTAGRDLEIRGAPQPVETAYCDLLDAASFAPALDAAFHAMDGVDTVVVTAGLFAKQEEMENDAELANRVLSADFTGTVLFCEEARKRLLAVYGLSNKSVSENTGATAGLSSSVFPGNITRTAGQAGSGAPFPSPTLCVFSSVAGDRGRKPVVLYGAAKAGLSQYLEGLDHKYRSAGLRTVCVKPGFVATGMTAGLKPPPFAGEPEAVARRVLKAIDRGRPVVYAPAAWRWVMCAIRKLPRCVMRKIEF